MTETRIRWEDQTPGSEDVYNVACIGYVGTVAEVAFIIYTPDELHDNWLLSTRLTPGGQFRYADTQDKLKAEAERWLEQFVVSLGAVFPPEPAPDPDCPECGFGLPRHDKNCSQHPCSGSPWTCEYCAISCHFKHLGNGEPAKASQ